MTGEDGSTGRGSRSHRGYRPFQSVDYLCTLEFSVIKCNKRRLTEMGAI